MKPLPNQANKKHIPSADDEVGLPLWKLPEEDDETDEEIGEIHPVPTSERGVGIHAPGTDPLRQQQWEEEQRRQQQEEEEKQRRENPRGVWKM